LHEAADEDLRYWSQRIGKALKDGTAKYPAKDKPLHAAMLAEIDRRKGGNGNGAAPAHQKTTALAPRDLKDITGSLRDPTVITERLQMVAQSYHLVTPAPACPRLPEGCSVALSAVTVAPETETFDIGGGKLALSKSALEKIAAAAGISWDPIASRRLDDGSDPYYCVWRAVGTWRDLDGTPTTVVKCKEMDLRDDSAQVEALWERFRVKHKKWEDNGKKGYEPKNPEGQIREMRLHIMAHAESKAQLRVIRSLGLRPSYSREEFSKPWIVAKLMWTGESDDPALRRLFAEKQADAMLGGVRSLYGDTAPAAAPEAGFAPPPVGTTALPADVEEIDYDYDAPTESDPEPPAEPAGNGSGNGEPGQEEMPY